MTRFYSQSVLLCHALLILLALVTADDAEDAMKQARLRAKPWVMRSLEIGGVNLFFSPATLITVTLVLLQLYYAFFGSRSWVEASHILIKDTSPKTKKAAVDMVKDIGSNARKFGDLAQKYSQCPSKVKKGDLGRFYPGDMAPAFDKACFDPSTKVGTTIGPIQTHFGYHLIFIRERKL